MTANLFYRLIARMTEVDIPLDTGDFRLLDRQVVDVMGTMRERFRFLRGMTSWIGFRQAGVPYKRAARYAGSTKYPFKKMLRLALNAVTGFSFVPLQLISSAGVIVIALAVLAWIAGLLLHLRSSGIPPFLRPDWWLCIFWEVCSWYLLVSWESISAGCMTRCAAGLCISFVNKIEVNKFRSEEV